MLDAGYWMLDAGYWMLDARCWMTGAGCALRVAGCTLRVAVCTLRVYKHAVCEFRWTVRQMSSDITLTIYCASRLLTWACRRFSRDYNETCQSKICLEANRM